MKRESPSPHVKACRWKSAHCRVFDPGISHISTDGNMPVWTLYPYYRPARLVAGEHLRTGDIQYQYHSQAVTVRSQGHNGSFRRNFLFFFPVESLQIQIAGLLLSGICRFADRMAMAWFWWMACPHGWLSSDLGEWKRYDSILSSSDGSTSDLAVICTLLRYGPIADNV